jgi:biopolymer transport protein ExbD
MRATRRPRFLVALLFAASACRSKPSATLAVDAGGRHVDGGHVEWSIAEVGVAVVVTKTSLIVDDEVVLQLPPRDEAAATGFASKNKAASPDGAIVLPLAEVLRKYREQEKAAGRTYEKAIIVAPPSTPYRIVSEVLTTLKHDGIKNYQFVVLQDQRDAGDALRTAAPLPHAPPTHEDPDPARALKVKLESDALVFESSRGGVGPACKRVPRIAGGRHDLDGIRRCAQEMKKHTHQDTAVSMSASGATPYGEIIEVYDAIRTDGSAELFPAVSFAPPP